MGFMHEIQSFFSSDDILEMYSTELQSGVANINSRKFDPIKLT